MQRSIFLLLAFLLGCTIKNSFLKGGEGQNQNAHWPPTYFSGHEGEFITMDQFIDFTSRYQTSDHETPRAHFFGKHKLNQILNQQECVGIRFYQAVREDSTGGLHPTLVAVGTRSDFTDIKDGLKLEFSSPCPPICGDSLRSERVMGQTAAISNKL